SIQLRPTGIHTHFPYTTLFRSLEQLLTVGDGLVENALKHGWYGRHSESPVLRRGRGRARWRNAAGDGGSLFHLRAVRGQVRSVRDRKSTRLNSSHVKISYAVFC